MSDTYLSVVMPVYNVLSPFINIDLYANLLELIVVDDCSTDGSTYIARHCRSMMMMLSTFATKLMVIKTEALNGDREIDRLSCYHPGRRSRV